MSRLQREMQKVHLMSIKKVREPGAQNTMMKSYQAPDHSFSFRLLSILIFIVKAMENHCTVLSKGLV